MSNSSNTLSLPFGSLIPHGDPTWYQGWHSPYYNITHVNLRNNIRVWVEKHIMPFCHEWDEKKEIPKEIFTLFAKEGYLAMLIGPHNLKKEHMKYNLPDGITLENFDSFHELIVLDELSRCGSGGVLWALQEGLSIGLPPVLLFGNKALQDKVVKPCLAGEKVICLAITEPTAGSDVAALSATAVQDKDGNWILNGSKKWITNGTYADFFTVAARTGTVESGMNGLTLFLVERNMKGLSTRQMKCSGVWPSGTAFVQLDNVKVPAGNVIGEINKGFRYIMLNFNHERWNIVVQATRFARVCLEESMQHAQRRSTFGKKLIDHPVIRNKLAHMTRHVEATQSMLESVTYQLCKMPKEESMVRLGGPIALLKAQATTTFELCAREASQIFGGLAYTRGGLGEKVERLYREVRAYAIPAGSEEIMLDLGIKQAIKNTASLKAKLAKSKL